MKKENIERVNLHHQLDIIMDLAPDGFLKTVQFFINSAYRMYAQKHGIEPIRFT